MDAPITIRRLVWDAWNREHIKKHGVNETEVEEAVRIAPTHRKSYKERTLVIGPSRSGNVFAVVVGPDPAEPGAFCVSSARRASRQERRRYRTSRGEA